MVHHVTTMVDFLARAMNLVRGAVTQLTWKPSDPASIVDALERRAATAPNAPFLVFEGERWTYESFNAAVNQHAHAWAQRGIRPGDVVALMMGNRPSFLMHLYGLSKIGAIAALINPKLRDAPLQHALVSCDPKAVVTDAGAWSAVATAQHSALSDLKAMKRFRDGSHPPAESVETDDAVSTDLPTSDERWDSSANRANPEFTRRMGDVMAYIYTSGTTGKPKPAIVKHHRFYRAGLGGAIGLGLQPGDGIYNCLPLYHANGVVIAASSAICGGARLVLARRFSTRRFWADVHDTDATHFIYIGEVCRYLLGAPPHPLERAHAVRVIMGNGLRADVWTEFQERFSVPRIIEFYGSTEGNAETVNLLGTPGSCGVLLPGKMALVRCDATTGELQRGADGRCITCAAGEVGVLLGHIKKGNEFEGYRDPAASESKVARGVFAANDAWFNTGDLLRRDRLFRLYFVDRLGDTFRWKGENVATTEVAEVISGCDGVLECNVYGVEVPGAEGRAGMAAIVIDDSFDRQHLYAYLQGRLPAYAQPRFLRVVETLAVTGTFKHRKVELRKEAYDLAVVTDPLLVADQSGATYQSLDAGIVAQVKAGTWKI